jgi:hypothetical protein
MHTTVNSNSEKVSDRVELGEALLDICMQFFQYCVENDFKARKLKCLQ